MNLRRTLSADERRLWDEVARSVKRRTPAPEQKPHAQANVVHHDAAPLVTGAFRPHGRRETQTSFDPAPSALPFGLTQLDGRRARRFAKGDLPIDARIDLHGLSLAHAHQALLSFLAVSLGHQRRALLVITGKGKDGAPGAIRREAPRWLLAGPFAADIVALQQAQARHGGEGAFYVYLRRERRTA